MDVLVEEDYTLVDRIGGALWILFLSLIAKMVFIIPRVKAREMQGHKVVQAHRSRARQVLAQPDFATGNVNQKQLP